MKLCKMTGNQLKIIALIAMTCDHVGKILLSQIGILQIVGRLAFPIFAYMIAEGCVHTKSKKRYLLDYAKKKRNFWSCLACVFGFAIAVSICVILPWLIPNTDFAIDYGILGVMVPVFVYLGKTKTSKLVLMGAVLFLLCVKMGGFQWYSLLVPILMSFYSGQRGTLRLKHLFYIYYPLHLVGIYIIGVLLF